MFGWEAFWISIGLWAAAHELAKADRIKALTETLLSRRNWEKKNKEKLGFFARIFNY